MAMPGRVAALRAQQPSATQRHLHDRAAALEADRRHPHPLQAQKPGKCRGDAHVVLPRKPLTFEQPAACPARAAARRQPARNFRELQQRGKRLLRTRNPGLGHLHPVQEPPKCEDVKSISEERLIARLGTVTDAITFEIGRALRFLLDL